MHDNRSTAGNEYDDRPRGGRWGGGYQSRQDYDGRQAPRPQDRRMDGDGRGYGDGWRERGHGYMDRGPGRDGGYRGGYGYDGRSGGYRDDGHRGRGDGRDQVTCDVVAQLGILGENREKNTTRELRLVSWNGRRPKLDIRDWGVNPDGSSRCFKGLTLFDDEARRLMDALADYFSANGQGQGGNVGGQGKTQGAVPEGQTATPGAGADQVPF